MVVAREGEGPRRESINSIVPGGGAVPGYVQYGVIKLGDWKGKGKPFMKSGR